MSFKPAAAGATRTGSRFEERPVADMSAAGRVAVLGKLPAATQSFFSDHTGSLIPG
jgi:hypothetical protein